MRKKEEIIKQLSISADLSEEFMKQSAFFAEYAFLHARAQDKVRELEERLDLTFSELYREAREEIDNAKENDCKAFIRRDERYQEAQAALRKAKYTCDVMRSTVKAFDMRRDMLVQLGAQARSEFDSTDLKTREARMKRKRANRVVRRTYNKGE